jgi:hypothetical protein
MDLVHQQIQLEKGIKKVTESSKGKATVREDTVLEHSISKRICQHCATRDRAAFNQLNHHLPPTSGRKQAT